MKRGFLLSAPNPKLKSKSEPSPRTPNPKPKSSTKPNPQIDAADRLSSLPDPILHLILSLLPTDEMVRTSALSSRWARLWTHSPVLHFTPRDFASCSIELEDFPSIVDRCLPQCAHSRKIRSLRLPLTRDPACSSSLRRWLRFAAARAIVDLALIPLYFGNLFVEMPPSLFDCRSLASLKIDRCKISAALPSGFPLLRTLVLAQMSIEDDTLEALLTSCPQIESLSLSTLRQIKRLVVRAPMLRHLMVYKCNGLDRVEIVEAPELRRLMYSGDVEKIRNVPPEFAKIEEVALLSTYKRPFKNNLRQWKKLVAAVAHARVLSINNWLFKFPLDKDFGSGGQPIIFKNLKELHWWPVYKKCPELPVEPWCAKRISEDSLRTLFSALRYCPSLEHLCIKSTYYLELEEDEMLEFETGFSFDGYCSGRLPFPEFDGVGYELPCLKTVTITEFAGRKEEIMLLEFLATKAAALESVCLHYVGEIKENLGDIRRVLNDFHQAFPRASTIFQEFDDDKQCSKHEGMWFDYMIL